MIYALQVWYMIR